MLYKNWHGTEEEFAKTQHQKRYHHEYMKNSKQYVESVRIECSPGKIPTTFRSSKLPTAGSLAT